MTTDNLPSGQPAATHRTLRGAALWLCTSCLLALALPVFAQSAPVVTASADTMIADPSIALPEPPPAPVSTTASIKRKAAEAATATLTALLPRLAASDTMPLLDRSTLVAGDISRLLASYDFPQAGVVAQQEGGKVQTLLKRALTLMGTPYRWGGTSPDSGFDCSGLVGYVFQTALGIELPRVSRDMASKADALLIKDREDLQQGDLVFFGLRGRVNHVGIYVGEGRFLHSPSTGKDVRVDTLLTGYWGNRYMQARRVAL